MKSRSETERTIPETIVTHVLTPVERLLRTESASGIVLVTAAVVAIVWANSPWRDLYFEIRNTPFSVRLGSVSIEQDLLHWVNDFLMALFFFVIGLEIKRELLVGELAGWRKAALPAACALGGMVLPALIYTGSNWGSDAQRGWGIPMATDIAFAIGILTLLGSRVSLSLKTFLLALAVVDDLGAVVVIAAFYSSNFDPSAFAIAIAIWAVAVFHGRARVSRPVVYIGLGLLMWYFMFRSGVHATIAGILLAFAVPMRHGMEPRRVYDEVWSVLQKGGFEQVETKMDHLQKVVREGQSALHRFERTLNPYAAFLVMPVFAIFNAGVSILDGQSTGSSVNVLSPVSLGVFLGLVLGKPVGIIAFGSLAMAAGAIPPGGVDRRTMLGVGLLGGIGFTMSLFIADLAFGASPALLDQAKLAILSASVTAASIGLAYLALICRGRASTHAAANTHAQTFPNSLQTERHPHKKLGLEVASEKVEGRGRVYKLP